MRNIIITKNLVHKNVPSFYLPYVMVIYSEKDPAFKHMYLMCKEIIPNSGWDIVCVGTVKLNFNQIRKKYQWEKLIGYNFEQLYDGQRFLKPGGNILEWFKNANEHWDYDLNNIQYCKDKFSLDVKYKPLVYSENLLVIENNPNPTYDVLFYGLGTPYRKKVAKFLEDNCPGLKFNFYLPTTLSGYISDNELDALISDSKIVLNLLSVSNIQPQSRIFYNLINSKCVVSEKCLTNMYDDLICEEQLENLPKLLNNLIESGKWKDYADKASNGFKELSNDWKNKYWNI